MKSNLLSLNGDWDKLRATGRAVRRGGNWNNGADAGLFSANLNNAPSDTNSNIGFRCCNSPDSERFCFYGNKIQYKGTTVAYFQAEKLNINLDFTVSRMILLKMIESCKIPLSLFNRTSYLLKMKTYKNLFEKVVDFENLYSAFLKARKGKNSKKEVLNFNFNLENELLKLQEELQDEVYRVGEYRRFIIYESKKREIFALPFKDRVVQHAICNIIEPIFNKGFIYDSYACRKNKGTHKGVKRVQSFLKKGDRYALKCDIKHYFPSVNCEILKKLIRKKIGDEKLLDLIDNLLNSGDGLPIGNLTSQLFANIYLNELDRFVKQELRCKFYIRYMDDFIIFGNKDELMATRRKIFRFICNLKLKVHYNKAQIFPDFLGVDFLGYVIYDYRMRVRKRTVKRFLKRVGWKIGKYDRGLIQFEKLAESFNSWEAYMEFGRAFGLKNKLYKERFKDVV